MVGLALAANTQTSALSAIATTALLQHPELPALVQLHKKRLAENYSVLTATLARHSIPYIPCNAGLYVFAQVAPGAKTWEEEREAVARLKERGVLVSAGQAYHGPESDRGWARIGFAVSRPVLEEALRRLDSVYQNMKEST